MMPKLLQAFRSLIAVLAGYLVIAVGTTLTFEALLDGGFGYHSSPKVLVLGTLGALLSGIAGGAVAALAADCYPLRHAAAVAIPIALDTASVLSSGPAKDPIWFDLGGSLTLVIGALIGGWLLVAWSGTALDREPEAQVP